MYCCVIHSVVKMFANHKDDRKKVEKALEAAHLPHGKVNMHFSYLHLSMMAP